MARSVLGRGLSALIPNKDELDTSFKYVETGKVSPNPKQPRSFSQDQSFQELVKSVKRFGILQPLIIRRNSKEEERYEIVAGERRYRAAIEVGITRLPAVVKKVKSDIESFELALIENIQRQDLSPIDEAQAFRYLLDDCNISQDKLAKLLGKSRSSIANSVRLLNLDSQVQELVDKRVLSAGHARVLVPLERQKQRTLARKVIDEGISVRALEGIVGSKTIVKKVKNKRFDNLESLENEFRQSTDLEVQIISEDNKGYVKIYFENKKELKRLKQKLL